MQTSLPTEVIGCIGKCTTGLTVEELDQITDNIDKTLSHPKGRLIFDIYLEKRRLETSLECLKVYTVSYDFLAKVDRKSKESDAEFLGFLSYAVSNVKEMVENCDGVPQFNMGLINQINRALGTKDKGTLITALNAIKNRSQDYLSYVHKDFKRYASEPCPKTRGREKK